MAGLGRSCGPQHQEERRSARRAITRMFFNSFATPARRSKELTATIAAKAHHSSELTLAPYGACIIRRENCAESTRVGKLWQ
jgi:hypothetical protein